jgi:hypothetical protein
MNSNLDNITHIFDQMAYNGWDTSGNLKWGFFFVDASKEKLVAVYKELEEKDYVLEDIYLTEDNRWTLQVSKIDTLTPEKLHKRNLAFNELVQYCGAELYDGWDVERLGSQ